MSEDGQDLKQVDFPTNMTVRELAQMIDTSPIAVIKTLMSNGVMANINQMVDFDTAAIVAAEMGYEANLILAEEEQSKETGEIPLWRRLIANEPEESLVARAPVVTILGHVDHGKTTLLDAVRSTNVASGEAGGITQHIGAYQARHNDRLITFLDTPGHAAFTAMRARGAQGADIVILVVAADDGVMPQTKEAIAHSKAAQVPIVVALNKIDRSNANPDLVKQQLADNGLVSDEWDGDTIVVPISAKQQKGLDDLLEAILLVSDSMDIRANPKGKVFGTVIEAERDKARGVIATFLVQNGTLKAGDMVVVGTTYGHVRAMFDYTGGKLYKAGPATPVSIMGLNDVPQAGDVFQVVKTDKEARNIVSERKQAKKEAGRTPKEQLTLEKFFETMQAGAVQELRLVVKADVQGSLSPILTSLEELSTPEVGVKILHSETGNIGENDVMLAAASNAIVIGFNVQADASAKHMAEVEGVSIRLYNIIYRMTEDITKALKGMLAPEEEEVNLGKAEVLAIFRVPKLGRIAGCKVVSGVLRRNARLRVLRAGKTVFDGEFASLKHEKDDVREIRQGFECGVGAKGTVDFQVGDLIECYENRVVADGE